jgi:hypothetical protein
MACIYPVPMIIRGEVKTRPCGYCQKCRLEKSKEWSIRIMHESMMHENNCFLSLTFNNENLPQNGSINPKDVQLFIKRLRHHSDDPIRFYACGEYGALKFRPHYHALIFGFDFDDKEIFKVIQKPDGSVYNVCTSEKLQKLWPYGFSTTAELTMETALYTARYVQKKITGNSEIARQKKEEKYGDKKAEFALMSRKPGIGKPWFDKYSNDVYPKDFVTINGCYFKPPRYYDTLYATKNPYHFNEIRKLREERGEEYFRKNYPDVWNNSRHKYYELLTQKFERMDL